MTSKTLSSSFYRYKSKSKSLSIRLFKFFKWRWISILLLGITANTLVNVIFDYKYQRSLVSISLEEYINAIIAAFILLEGTRWISKKLDQRIPWKSGILKRLGWQLVLEMAFLMLLLNILVIGVTYLFYGGFYKIDELMVINLSMISMTLVFSMIDIGIFFYHDWKHSHKANNEDPIQLKKPIKISLGKSSHIVKQENIRTVTSESGSILIKTEEGRNLIYSDSLDTLMKQLDPDSFFRANRQTIISHSVVKSTRSLEYGKVEVTMLDSKHQTKTTIISRTKAAQFRKWLKLQIA
ncbi:LytTR family DNA-binding domain-containing protein [Roseivirga misakiensis]|uniref:HTH LytTR-type domain-containing protein n=1 Tax=Roseivirga misakiensis TaxID=1563681 RepID=A0A1E5SZ16_9BACT|nr:LytTR family DNA-binding domain-containing protein [Roseivirga misakiensis]OEK04373.1 hypothetical protein BFP71_12890 [Roseivirga misakiensis]